MGTQVWIDGEFGLNPNIMDDAMATMAAMEKVL